MKYVVMCVRCVNCVRCVKCVKCVRCVKCVTARQVRQMRQFCVVTVDNLLLTDPQLVDGLQLTDPCISYTFIEPATCLVTAVLGWNAFLRILYCVCALHIAAI